MIILLSSLCKQSEKIRSYPKRGVSIIGPNKNEKKKKENSAVNLKIASNGLFTFCNVGQDRELSHITAWEWPGEVLTAQPTLGIQQ